MRGVIAFVSTTLCVFGQTYQRHAAVSGQGSLDSGQCIVEVIVDTKAEVQIRGTIGILTGPANASPKWSRFDCTGPMPVKPNTFEFAIYEGRGQQRLLRDPSETGVAIVRVDDKVAGPTPYMFTLTWDGHAATPNLPRANLTSVEAVEMCQQDILNQATKAGPSARLYFRRAVLESDRSGLDQIHGTIDIDSNRYRYHCAVELKEARFRWAQIEREPTAPAVPDYGFSTVNALNVTRALQACETSVDRHLSEQALQRHGFASADLQEDSNRAFGSVTVANGDGRQQVFDFSCLVDVRAGLASTLQISPRR